MTDKSVIYDSDQCSCEDCQDAETPCEMDCDSESECRGCREERAAAEDRRFDEMKDMGYLGSWAR